MSCSCGKCGLLIPHLFTFFFNDTATTEIYTLSLHDALPIYDLRVFLEGLLGIVIALEKTVGVPELVIGLRERRDRKSTRLNSSHTVISYAVFCLKKKNTQSKTPR